MKKLGALIVCLAAVGLSTYAVGQRGGRSFGGFGGQPIGSDDGPAYRDKDESGFVYARIRYHMTAAAAYEQRRELPWHHDYPYADETFPDSLQRLTTAHSTRNSYQIVDIESKELFSYPYAYLCEPGYLDLLDEDVKNLREYLDRGGFLFIDDFRGPAHLANLDQQFKKLYPDRELKEIDLNHPIFHTFFELDSLDMKPPYGNNPVQFLALSDPKGRIQAIVDYNNDLSEYWELIDRGDKPLADSAKSIRLGVNYAIYAMTH